MAEDALDILVCNSGRSEQSEETAQFRLVSLWTTSILAVLYRLTAEMTEGEDRSKAIIFVLSRFICNPKYAASSHMIRSSSSS